MTLDLHVAPLVTQFTTGIDQKSATHDAHELLAVQRLFMNNIEVLAKRLVRIRNQVEGKLLFFKEFFILKLSGKELTEIYPGKLKSRPISRRRQCYA